jgi:hypothetical protein
MRGRVKQRGRRTSSGKSGAGSRTVSGVLGRFARRVAGNRSLDAAAFDALEAEHLAGFQEKVGEGRAVVGLSRVQSYAFGVAQRRGLSLVLAGDPRGWCEVERGWLLDTVTAHWIGPHMASGASMLLAHALALGEDVAAGWMVDALRARMEKDADLHGSQALPFFLHRLYDMALGGTAEPLPLEAPPLGPYQAVLDAWDAPEVLERALFDLCDHRLLGLGYPDRDDQDGWPPRRPVILPLDIAAVAAVRRRRGEEMPTIVHPLTEPPLGAIPARRTYRPEEDPWFLRALDAAVAAGRAQPDFRWPSPGVE